MISSTIGLLNVICHNLTRRTLNISLLARINNSTLADNVRIEKGTRISESRIGPRVIIGEDCIVSDSALERDIRVSRDCWLWQVEIGAYSYVAPRAELGLTRIGRFCSIGARLQCTVGDHPTTWVSTNPVFFSTLKQCGTSFSDKDLFEERKGICIGNDVWIGSSVLIKDGTTIGNGAIVAGGAAVMKNVPDYAVVGGVPAKVIRFRFDNETIRQLLAIQWWNWNEAKLHRAQTLFAQANTQRFLEWALQDQ